VPVFHGDRGYMRRETTGPVDHWSEVPVSISLDPGISICTDAAKRAIAYINGRVGNKLLVFEGDVKNKVVVYKREDGGCRDNGFCTAYTEVYDDETGLIVAAGVFVPGDPRVCGHPEAWRVIAHEFGHLLSLLDDGNDVQSMMSQEIDLSGPFAPLTDADVVRLIVLY
jgi:hypothetical protein